jgi:hypothetical protein
MSVIFRDYGTSSSGTTPGDTPSAIDPGLINISRFTPEEIDFSILYGGLIYKIAFIGRFNTADVGFTPLTLADLKNTDLGTSSAISQVVLSQAGSYLSSKSFSPAVTFDQWEAFDDQTLDGLIAQLSGNDIYYNSSEAAYENGSNCYYLFGGNDTLYQAHQLLQYDDVFYGGDGIDKAVLPGVLSSYTLTARDDVWNQLEGVGNLIGYVISHNEDAVNYLQLHEVERLQFTDTMLALDTAANENAGNSYLLYQAAFDRTPDVEGLGYWISKVDGGANIVRDVAQNFILSNEFKSLYGANPTATQFTNLLYQNVLHRLPDAEGLNYWLTEFARDGDSLYKRAGTLNNFAISAENIANVADQIIDGIHYQAYVG